MPSKRTPDSVVNFKGISNGILMALELNNYEFDKVIRKAVSIYKKKRSFFGQNIDLYATGYSRELTVDEIGMTRKMFSYLAQKEVFPYKETPSQKPSIITYPDSNPQINDLQPSSIEVTSDNIDSNEFLVIGKDVRAGIVVQSPGSIVVFGNIHSGAKVIAGKSLFVYGSIKGDVTFAFSKDCNQAMLTCLKLQAISIRSKRDLIDNPIQTLKNESSPLYILHQNGITSIVTINDG